LVLSSEHINAQWVLAGGPYGNYYFTEVAMLDNGYIIAGGSNLYLSKNKGVTWTTVKYSDYIAYYAGSIDCESDKVVVGGYNGVYLSTDNGVNFKDISPTNSERTLSVKINSGNIYACTYRGLFLSSNNGVSWIKLYSLGQYEDWVRGVEVDKSNIFIISDDYICRSNDTGTSWKSISGQLPDDMWGNLLCKDGSAKPPPRNSSTCRNPHFLTREMRIPAKIRSS